MFPWLSVNVADNVQLFPEHLMNAWISDAVLGALTCGTCVRLAKCLRSVTSITIVSSVVCVVHFRFIDLCITVILSDGADSCPRQARCAESSRRSRLLVPTRRRLTTTPACRSEQAPGEAACSANTYSLEKRVKSLLAVCGSSHYCDVARAALCGPPFQLCPFTWWPWHLAGWVSNSVGHVNLVL